MELLIQTENTCALCGKPSKHQRLTSDTMEGSPDLDWRPAEPLRSTMPHWIEECPHCGYTNHKINIPCAVPKEVLRRDYMLNREENETAARFLKRAWLMLRTDKFFFAGYDFLRVAWVFDDLQDVIGSLTYRKMASDALARSLAVEITSQEICACLLMDVLRRNGGFDRVMDTPLPLSSLLEPYGRFQIKLAREGDTSIHKLDEIPGADPNIKNLGLWLR